MNKYVYTHRVVQLYYPRFGTVFGFQPYEGLVGYHPRCCGKSTPSAKPQRNWTLGLSQVGAQ
jgi:hypothetical protein